MASRVYPSWWKDRSKERKARIDAALERLCVRLSTIDSVQSALVFGSYARGEIDPQSDVDLIVIQETTLSQGLRAADLYGQLACEIPLDMVVYTPEEFERLRQTRGFVKHVAGEARRIYARAPA